MVILAEKDTLGALCLNELHHVILDVLVAPYGENNIFAFFGVWHANQRRKKMVSIVCDHRDMIV